MTIQILEGFKQTDIGLIPEEWEVVKLGDLFKISSSKRIFASEYINDGIPFFRGKEIIELSKGNDISTELFISNEKYSEIQSKYGVPQIGDILLSSVGTLGIPYLIKTNDKFYFKDGNITQLHSSKSEKINSKFLIYYIQSNIGRHELLSGTIGSTQQALTITALNKVNTILPTIKEQKAIAEVLSSLDDKIELLEKQNKTLENIGQAIFKSWFVDFEGFEDDLVESEIGMIPRGWKVGKIKDYINFIVDNRGKTPATILPGTEGIIPMIEINSLIGGGRNINIELIKKGVTEEIYNSWFRKGHPERGDVLFSTVGSIGEIGLVYDEKICIAQNIVSLRPNVGGEYLYELLKNIKPNLLGLDISTVQPSIKLPHLLNFQVLIPNDKIITNFINTTKDNSEKIYTNKKQIQNLSNLRNSILPRLMNGKLRVNFNK